MLKDQKQLPENVETEEKKTDDLLLLRNALGLPENSPYQEYAKNYEQKTEDVVSKFLEENREKHLVEIELKDNDEYLGDFTGTDNSKRFSPLSWLKRRILLKKAEYQQINLKPYLSILEQKFEKIDYKKLYQKDVLSNFSKIATQLSPELFVNTLQRIDVITDTNYLLYPDSFKSNDLTDIFIKIAQVPEQKFISVLSELSKYYFIHNQRRITNDDGTLARGFNAVANLILNGEIPDSYKKIFTNAEKGLSFTGYGNLPIIDSNNKHETAVPSIDIILSQEAQINQDPQVVSILNALAYEQLLEDPDNKPKIDSNFYPFVSYLKESGKITDLLFIINNGVSVEAIFSNQLSHFPTAEHHAEIAERISEVAKVIADPDSLAWMEILHELLELPNIKFAMVEKLQKVYKKRDIILNLSSVFQSLSRVKTNNSEDIVKVRELFYISDQTFTRDLEIVESQVATQLSDILSNSAGNTNEHKLADFFGLSIDTRYRVYYTDYKISLEDLPLHAFLAKNIENIDDFVQNRRPKAKLLEQIAEIDLPVERKKFWFNLHPNETIKLSSDLLLSSLDFLQNPLFIMMALKHEPETLTKKGLPNEYAEIFTYLRTLDIDIQRVLIDTEVELTQLFTEGKPNTLFFDQFLRKTDTPKFDHLLTPEFLMQNFESLRSELIILYAQTYSEEKILEIGLNQEQISFLLYLQNIPTDIQNLLSKFPLSLTTVITNGLPRIDLFNYLLEHETLPDFSNLLTDEVLATYQSPEKEFFTRFRDSSYSSQELIKKNRPEIEQILTQLSSQPEKIDAYFSLIEEVAESPSQEIQRFKEALVSQLLEVEEPLVAYKKIEDIFIANNLPTVGKIYKIFLILHPPEEIKRKLENTPTLSPILQTANENQREKIIYNDLLNIAIKTNNESLRKYLEFFQNNGIMLQKLEELGWNQLAPNEQKIVETLIKKSITLHNSFNPETTISLTNKTYTEDEINTVFAQLKASFGISNEATFSEEIINFFTKSLGYTSIFEILHTMDTARASAHKRGLEYAKQFSTGTVKVEAGDLIKSIDEKYFSQIIRNGNLSKEYLGASADTDATAFDTDVSYVLPDHVKNDDPEKSSINQAIEASLASGNSYGGLKLIFKNRGQFHETNSETEFSEETMVEQRNKYELFCTGVLDQEEDAKRHYGIRTGIPFTEVDFIVAQPNLISDLHQMQNIFFTIAEQNYYIPIVDTNGNLVFTPEQYDEYRKIFDGIPDFSGNAFEVSKLPQNSRLFERLSQTKEDSQKNIETVSKLQNRVKEIIKQVLEEFDIPIQDIYSQHLFEAELHDTGSTGRYTNTLDGIDFDLLIRIDSNSFKKSEQIKQRLLELLQPTSYETPTKEGENILIKAKQSQGIDPDEQIDIDIFLVKKSMSKPFATYDSVTSKLNTIKEEYGEDTHTEVIANIILAKNMLREAEAYKKVDGGFGGVGVENWILQHNGNIEQAFRSFWDAAHQNGNIRSIQEFKQNYKLLDAGVDLISGRHDNFIGFLSETAYLKILQMIAKTLELT